MLLCQPAPRRRMDWRNWLLLASSVTIALLIAEFVFRYLPLGDMAGWSMVAPVAERAAAVPPKGGRTRIVALGDSFTEWRDNTGHSFVRVAEREQVPDIGTVEKHGPLALAVERQGESGREPAGPQ